MDKTHAEMIREAVEELGRARPREIMDWIQTKYPELSLKVASFRADIIGCSVNHTSSHYYPNMPKFLFFEKDTKKYRIYDPEKDGEWVVNKSGAHLVNEESYRKDLEKTSLGLERDLEEHLLKNLSQLGKGLELYSQKGTSLAGRQFKTGVGKIDILAVDKEGNFFVIELKAGTAGEGALGQILSYIRWVRINMGVPQGKGVSGIIIANDFDERLKYAASEVPVVLLKRYEVKFDFRDEPEVND